MLALDAPDAVSVDAAAVDPANDGRRVHITGTLVTASPVADAQFGVVGKAACLRRREETRSDQIPARRPQRAGELLDIWSPRESGPVVFRGF